MQEKINGKSGQNQINMQDSNRAEVLRFLALHPGCSRAELGEATGLTQASMTKIVRSLTKSGLITPAVDFEHLEEVLVITELKQVVED